MSKELLTTHKNKDIYRDGNKLVKAFIPNYPKSVILNEATNLAKVEETGVNVPALLEVSQIDGRWCIVQDYIEGTTLDVLFKQNPEKFDEYMDLFVSLHMDILSKKYPLLVSAEDKYHVRIDIADLDVTTKYDLHTKLNAMPKLHHLLHGDFEPSNVIIANDGKIYIIDWSHVVEGVPANDVAKSYCLFYLHGDVDFATKYLETYCKKANVDQKEVMKWVPLVAASLLTQKIAKEEEQLREWIDLQV